MKEVGDLPALRLSAYPSALFLAYPLHMKLVLLVALTPYCRSTSNLLLAAGCVQATFN